MFLSKIWEYPVKSCQATTLQSAIVTPEGLLHDRRHLFMTEEGRFITQREYPQMANISAYHDGQDLVFEIAEKQQRILKQDFRDDKKVRIWKDIVHAKASVVAPTLISEFLGINLTLVELPLNKRPISDASANGHVSFADGLPYLLTTTGSLDDLNKRLSRPVDMLNFRPNLVVKNKQAYAEDNWSRIRVGEVVFRAVKPCSRCIMTTIDVNTGKPAIDNEPLKTLAGYRAIAGLGVMFGVNFVSENNGRVHIQDPVEVL